MIFVAVFRMIYTSPEYDSGLTFGSAIVQCKTQTQIIQLTTTSSYARFLSSVSIKKCFDATKAWYWIIARMSTNTNTKVHKYLDHCNEHEEKNTLGLHGAVDRLLLPVHHIQLENYGAIK